MKGMNNRWWKVTARGVGEEGTAPCLGTRYVLAESRAEAKRHALEGNCVWSKDWRAGPGDVLTAQPVRDIPDGPSDML